MTFGRTAGVHFQLRSTGVRLAGIEDQLLNLLVQPFYRVPHRSHVNGWTGTWGYGNGAGFSVIGTQRLGADRVFSAVCALQSLSYHLLHLEVGRRRRHLGGARYDW